MHRFTYWYKRNKPQVNGDVRRAINPQFWTLLIRLNVLLSKQDCEYAARLGLVYLNSDYPTNVDTVLKKGDIVRLPYNLVELLNYVKIQRVVIKKEVKKSQFIYFRNKESQ